MALDSGAILKKLVTIAQATGQFRNVNGYEIRSTPANGLTLSLIAGPLTTIDSSGLNRASMRFQVDGQIWLSMHTDPPESIDPRTMDAAGRFLTDLCGQFTLGGLVRCVDVHGMAGERLSATPGYVEMDGKLYRAASLVIPLLINDVFTLTA